ncbi:MAG: glucuronate isomerase [Cyclobacteriaceae bacterium]|nr:glucuronate isomerase [Cyclobacteriaceae bacterium]
MTFIKPDFLLQSQQAITLYEKCAAPSAIVDYHNHLSPKDIAENRQFNNLSEIWLEGDHYKWRAMRINGVPEEYCTGARDPYEKFLAWSKTVPHTLRNPLYHWTHLELKNYFNVNELLSEHTARAIYDHASAQLQQPEFRVQALLTRMNVAVVGTTDDPADSLEYHVRFAESTAGFKMVPTFRPDKSYTTHDALAYNQYLDTLGRVAGVTIQSLDDLLQALKMRVDFFDSLGCRASDHGLEFLYFEEDALIKAAGIFKKVRKGDNLSVSEQQTLRSAVLLELSKWYHEREWAQQFHLGAIRNNNARMMKTLGPDTGFDSIGDFAQAKHMALYFNALDTTNQLARTIIYNLNPADNEVFATMLGNFSDGSIPGKMQWGSGWWFLDQKEGMEKQLNALSNMGLLSRFVGMVTDSRSFLSFPRHEYFRRILCNMLGEDMKNGSVPNDLELAGELVKQVCYHNAMRYFRF